MSVATGDGGDSFAKRYHIALTRHYRLTRSEKLTVIALMLGVVVIALVPFTFFLVLPGHVGVLYHVFTGGTETRFVYTEGIGVKLPWDRVYYYEVRTQARDEYVHALAKNGLSVEVKITALFHPIPAATGRLHKEIGPDYVERVVSPIVVGKVRDVIGKYGPHDIYRLNVDALEKEILGELRRSPATEGLIDFPRVVIRDLQLPASLNKAITHKLTEEQNAQAYKFLIAQAKQEAARKRIEAIGIQTFYSIVANALTPQLLTWRGIEATVQIARSNNAKVVIVGGGKDQLPLILGSDITKQPPLPAPTPVDPQANPLPSFDELPRLFPPDNTSSNSGSGSNGNAKAHDGKPNVADQGGGHPRSTSTAPAAAKGNR